MNNKLRSSSIQTAAEIEVVVAVVVVSDHNSNTNSYTQSS